MIEKRVVNGMRVMPGEELYTIADLSRVWITASVYEYELPLVKKGQAATVTLTYQPGVVLRGRIAYIYPYLDVATRTARGAARVRESRHHASSRACMPTSRSRCRSATR